MITLLRLLYISALARIEKLPQNGIYFFLSFFMKKCYTFALRNKKQ